MKTKTLDEHAADIEKRIEALNKERAALMAARRALRKGRVCRA